MTLYMPHRTCHRVGHKEQEELCVLHDCSKKQPTRDVHRLAFIRQETAVREQGEAKSARNHRYSAAVSLTWRSIQLHI